MPARERAGFTFEFQLSFGPWGNEKSRKCGDTWDTQCEHCTPGPPASVTGPSSYVPTPPLACSQVNSDFRWVWGWEVTEALLKPGLEPQSQMQLCPQGWTITIASLVLLQASPDWALASNQGPRACEHSPFLLLPAGAPAGSPVCCMDSSSQPPSRLSSVSPSFWIFSQCFLFHLLYSCAFNFFS